MCFFTKNSINGNTTQIFSLLASFWSGMWHRGDFTDYGTHGVAFRVVQIPCHVHHVVLDVNTVVRIISSF